MTFSSFLQRNFLSSSAFLFALLCSTYIQAMEALELGERALSCAVVARRPTSSDIFRVLTSDSIIALTGFSGNAHVASAHIADYAYEPTPEEMQAYIRSFYSSEGVHPNADTLQAYLKIRELADFLVPFIPGAPADPYFRKLVVMYRDLTTRKQEILHDGRPELFGQQQIMPDLATTDYGWNFPLVLPVHRRLLEFCCRGDGLRNMLDVGPGFGFDTLGMLATKKTKVIAVERQRSQQEALDATIRGSIQQHLDPQFPLKRFRAFHMDFLSFPVAAGARGAYDGINANKVFHFFDRSQSLAGMERSHLLLRPRGRLFITCLTPSPGSEIERFMASRRSTVRFPGYLFYRQENRILGRSTLGEGRIVEVREPTGREGSAYFLQTMEERPDGGVAVTSRVMHYHTLETLTDLFSGRFRVLDHMTLSPAETMGTDHMISVVAEKL